MKTRLAIAVLPFLLCSCKVLYAIGGGPLPDASHPEASANANMPAGSRGGAASQAAREALNDRLKQVYELGAEDGRRDRVDGLSESYGRHCADFDEATEDAFAAGYQKGYAGTP